MKRRVGPAIPTRSHPGRDLATTRGVPRRWWPQPTHAPSHTPSKPGEGGAWLAGTPPAWGPPGCSRMGWRTTCMAAPHQPVGPSIDGNMSPVCMAGAMASHTFQVVYGEGRVPARPPAATAAGPVRHSSSTLFCCQQKTPRSRDIQSTYPPTYTRIELPHRTAISSCGSPTPTGHR